MRTTLLSALALLLLAGGCASGGGKANHPSGNFPTAAAPLDPAFFNGKDLTGWSGPAMQYWSVKDGVIVGHSATALPRNEFIWSDQLVGDFYLAADVKLDPDTANGGIQFRSQKLPPNEAIGYQADMGKGVWGRLYHESGRKKLDWRDRGEAAAKPGEWNRYEILAVGDRIWTAINGKLAVSIRDPRGERSGYIALQIHAGSPITASYKILKFVRDPKVELIGMNEQQLNAELIAPEVDATALRGRGATRPATRSTTRKANGAKPQATAAPSAQPAPQSLAVSRGSERNSSSASATKPSTPARPSSALPAGVFSEQRFGTAPTTRPAPPAFMNGKFDLLDHDVVVFAGQTNMVRAQQAGYLESQLAVHFADREPRFRSMAWEADTVYQQWRDLNFGGWRDQLEWVGAKTLVVQFGQMEVLDRSHSLESFTVAYGKLLDELMQVTPRIIVLSPMEFEKTPGGLPDQTEHNGDIRAFATTARKLAHQRGLIYVDLIDPLLVRDEKLPLTTNGVHLNQEGHRLMAQVLARQLGFAPAAADRIERVRPAIIEKNQLWFENWRPMNWAFAYGDRQHVPFSHAIGDHPPLRIELEEYKPLIAAADEKIHSLAR